MEELRIDKLVHGGQGLGTLADGRKAFVWNALPGELVRGRVIKKKKSYVEIIAEEIIEPSDDRFSPEEDNYLATSPWQIMTFEAENVHKKSIVTELFAHEKVALPDIPETIYESQEWHYRNKMEYSFWGDDEGLHLALYRRGSHGKQIISGSKLAMPAIDMAANAMLMELQKLGTRAGDLKTIIVRCSQAGETVASLFVKPGKFPAIPLPKGLKGLRVYHSNPKSPASVPTKLLYEQGDVHLHDSLLGKEFIYDVDSFFQVNIPIFEHALATIKESCDDPTDMYAGVGSIGISIAKKWTNLIEVDAASAAMARINFERSGLKGEVIEASTEAATQYITCDGPVVFDPPRAGLHSKVIDAIEATLPPKIVYLSCNPATHARDLARLQSSYKITKFQVYNFFPRTPHIETLAVLELKN